MKSRLSILSLSALALSSATFATSDSTLEQMFSLNGTCQIDGVRMLSIRNNDRGQQIWMNLGQTHGALKLVSYDARSGHAELSYNGHSFSLRMAKGDFTPLDVIGASDFGQDRSNQTYSPIARVSNPLSNPQILPSTLLAQELRYSDEQLPRASTHSPSGAQSDIESSKTESTEATQVVDSKGLKGRARNFFMPRMNRVESALEGSNRPPVMPEGL